MFQLKLMNCWTKKINLNDDHVDVVAGSSSLYHNLVYFECRSLLFTYSNAYIYMNWPFLFQILYK